MTEITKYDDVIYARDVMARVEELREQRTPRFVAGWNMPGYMPESEPAEFADADDAKSYIVESIKNAEDSAENEEHAEALAGFAEDINLENDEFSVHGPDGFVYWVTEDGTMGLDAEETAELEALESLLSDIKGYSGYEQWNGDWYPGTLIRYSYFTDYAREVAEESGSVLDNAKWPNNCIDWGQAARELQQDYSQVEFDGVTYWYL